MFRLPILFLSLALGAGLVQPDRTAELRSKFTKESNAVKKAKIVPQLADAEFQQVQDLLKADNAAEGRRHRKASGRGKRRSAATRSTRK